MKKGLVLLLILFIPFCLFANGNQDAGETEDASVVEEELNITPIGGDDDLQADTIDGLLAQVKLTRLEVITVSQFETTVDQYEAQAGASMTAENRQELLDYLIAEILINQAAERDGVRVSNAEILDTIRQSLGVNVTEEQLRQYIEQQGADFDQYVDAARKSLLQQRYIMTAKRSLFESIAIPAAEEVEVFFNENSTEFINPELVRFSQIFFDTRNLGSTDREAKRLQAEGIRQMIVDGEGTFEEMVRLHSEDPSSAARGGDFGFLPRDDSQVKMLLGNEFFTDVFALEKDVVSEVFASNLGFHIVRVTEKLERKFLELDDPVTPVDETTVREYITAQLYSQKQQQVFEQAAEEVVDELREEAEVMIEDSSL